MVHLLHLGFRWLASLATSTLEPACSPRSSSLRSHPTYAQLGFMEPRFARLHSPSQFARFARKLVVSKCHWSITAMVHLVHLGFRWLASLATSTLERACSPRTARFARTHVSALDWYRLVLWDAQSIFLIQQGNWGTPDPSFRRSLVLPILVG